MKTLRLTDNGLAAASLRDDGVAGPNDRYHNVPLATTSQRTERRIVAKYRGRFAGPGMSISEVEVVPLAVGVEVSDDELTVSLADGRRISVPLVWLPRLLNATAAERAELRLLGRGEGIHWPRVDEDISVAGLLRGSPATRVPLDTLGEEARSVEYRQHERGETGHWCESCSLYPTEDYFVRRLLPAGELCNECEAKSRAGCC